MLRRGEKTDSSTGDDIRQGSPVVFFSHGEVLRARTVSACAGALTATSTRQLGDFDACFRCENPVDYCLDYDHRCRTSDLVVHIVSTPYLSSLRTAIFLGAGV